MRLIQWLLGIPMLCGGFYGRDDSRFRTSMPVTATGKILSVVLAALGMMMFPIFTVYVTSLLQKFNAQDKETQKP